MSFGWWMLILGACLLFAVVAVYVSNISDQIGDYSVQPMQRFETRSHQDGDREYEGGRSIGVANSFSRKVDVLMDVRQATWLNSDLPKESSASADKTPTNKGVRQIFINGQLVYDGQAVNKVTVQISGAKGMSKTKSTFVSSIHSEVPTRGLIIKAEPLEKILSGRKTLELRKKNNKTRGPIALIQKGSGTIVGVANIGECIGPMSYADFVERAYEHDVEANRLRSVYDEGYTIGWKLSKIKRLNTPVTYIHKPGAVTWVTLEESDRAALSSAMGLG